jgi:hypothetical protein
MGTVLAGVGWQRTKDVDSVSCLDCYESEYVVTRKSGLAPSMGFEAIICGGDGVVCAGAALRADFAGSVSLVTFGPVFGFEF